MNRLICLITFHLRGEEASWFVVILEHPFSKAFRPVFLASRTCFLSLRSFPPIRILQSICFGYYRQQALLGHASLIEYHFVSEIELYMSPITRRFTRTSAKCFMVQESSSECNFLFGACYVFSHGDKVHVIVTVGRLFVGHLTWPLNWFVC